MGVFLGGTCLFYAMLFESLNTVLEKVIKAVFNPLCADLDTVKPLLKEQLPSLIAIINLTNYYASVSAIIKAAVRCK